MVLGKFKRAIKSVAAGICAGSAIPVCTPLNKPVPDPQNRREIIQQIVDDIIPNYAYHSSEVAALANTNITSEELRVLLALIDPDGFRYRGNTIASLYHQNIPPQFIASILGIQQNGKGVYDEHDVQAFHYYNIPLSTIHKLAAVRDSSNNSIVQAKSLQDRIVGKNFCEYAKNGGTLDDIIELSKHYPRNIASHYIRAKLKMDNITMRNNGKPRALIILAQEGCFTEQGTWVRPLVDNYDRDVTVAGNKKEVQDAIAKTPSLQLLVIAADYGDSSHIQLAQSSYRAQDRSYRIDTSDDEFGSCLSTLHPDATIVLLSPKAGEGENSAKNIANSFAAWAPGRTIYAPTQYTRNMNVVNAYPFRGDFDGTRMTPTYTTKQTPGTTPSNENRQNSL